MHKPIYSSLPRIIIDHSPRDRLLRPSVQKRRHVEYEEYNRSIESSLSVGLPNADFSLHACLL